ncbi:hypothetical protein ACHAXS_008980 [Conticribra weissflogii]
MSSLISGIIDCVARPSTSDSPVRVVRKNTSKTTDSPKSVLDPHILAPADSESTATASQQGSVYNASHPTVPGEATAVFPVSTAEAVILIPSENDAESEEAGDDFTTSSTSVDNAIRQQFEAAFATFLYKNPAFTTMSHANLSRVRSKLLKESAKNARAEAELRKQLSELRERKRKTELELQRELLVVTRAKAAREAELRHKIWKMRQASMSLDETIKKELFRDSSTLLVPRCNSDPGIGDACSMEMVPYQGNSYPSSSLVPISPSGQYSSYPANFENVSSLELSQNWNRMHFHEDQTYYEELRKVEMEYARITADMEKLRQQIANCTI